jgi:hypothetical protein
MQAHNEVAKGTLVDSALRYTSSLVAKQDKDKALTWEASLTHRYLLHCHKFVTVPLKEKTPDEIEGLRPEVVNHLGGLASKEESTLFARRFITAVRIHRRKGRFALVPADNPGAAITEPASKAILDEVAQCLRQGGWTQRFDRETFETEFQPEVEEDTFFKNRSSQEAFQPHADGASHQKRKAEVEPEEKTAKTPAKEDRQLSTGKGRRKSPAKRYSTTPKGMDTDPTAPAPNVGSRKAKGPKAP